MPTYFHAVQKSSILGAPPLDKFVSDTVQKTRPGSHVMTSSTENFQTTSLKTSLMEGKSEIASQKLQQICTRGDV